MPGLILCQLPTQLAWDVREGREERQQCQCPLLDGSGSEHRRSNSHRYCLAETTVATWEKLRKGRKRVGTEIARDPARHAEHPLRGKGEETEHPYRRMRAVTEEKMSGRVGERWEEGYAVSHGESLGWAGGVTRKSGKEPEQFLILFPTLAEQPEYCTRGGTHNCPFQFCMLQYLFCLNKHHYSLDSMERWLWINSKLVSNNSEEKVFKGHLSLDPADEEENSWQLQVLQIQAD